MKNKIQKFSKGDFRLSKPLVEFDETNLVLIIGEGEVYRGNFQIKSTNGERIRGLVYPSSLRIKLKEPGFDGNPARIEFTYDGRGLRPGHVEKGKLVVVCNGGEFELSFTAIIEKPYVMTAYGKVQSTDDFKKLAIKDFAEAGRLFRSKTFYEILKYENERIFYLYDNMRKWSLGDQAMEEFLVGIKQKECIFLTLSGEGMLYEDIMESTKGAVNLMKNTWGYMPIDVESDGAFLKVLKPKITTEDFVGNQYELEYLIQKEHLHAGRNYGKIRFCTPYETLEYEIEVIQSVKYHENHRLAEWTLAQILNDYIHFEAGRIEEEIWLQNALEKMAVLRKLDPMNELYQLMEAHISYMAGRIEDAKWILENFNYNRFAIGKNAVINGYYLYMTALIRGKGSYTEKVLDEIGESYVRHQDSFELLYLLLQMDPRYKNSMKRLEALEQHYEFQCNKVLYYLEAYKCYEDKPVLFKKLGKFEVQTLNFATKNKMISKELALYVSNFASQLKYFDDKIFRIIVQLYSLYPERTILNAICTLLIKGNKTNKRYFIWYARAVEAELKIVQLYEYYMLTVDIDSMNGPLPKPIFLYFMHGNTLEYKKAAFLYANLLTYEVDDSELFAKYQEQMEAFTWKQLEKRRITEYLRILYKHICVNAEMTAEQKEAMKDICFSYSVSTKIPNMKCVLVIEKDGEIGQRVPYEADGSTIVQLHDKESRIVWEAMNGRYYTDSIAYETKRMFYEPGFLSDMDDTADGLIVDENEREELSIDLLKENGYDKYDLQEVLALCSHTVEDTKYQEEDYLTYLCYQLYREGLYDQHTLLYLANYYCSGTRKMRTLWETLKEQHIPAYKVGEKIITQMLFSECVKQEEKIFEDYYVSDGVYFRVKQAYLAYVCKEYLLSGRRVDPIIFEIILRECEKEEELADVCKIAVLKHYSKAHYPADSDNVLHAIMRQLCEKQIVFPFYFAYKESWMRELQLFDKSMISYVGKPGSTVKLHYRMKQGKREELGYRVETLLPMYETIYVKDYVLYEGESMNYYFEEVTEEGSETTSKEVLEPTNTLRVGKYGAINEMILMSPEEANEAMLAYKEEDEMAKHLFEVY